jgi:hypothetical protein
MIERSIWFDGFRIILDSVGDPHHHLVEVSAIARLRTTPA